MALGAGSLSSGLLGWVLATAILSQFQVPVKGPPVPSTLKKVQPAQWFLMGGLGFGLLLAAFVDFPSGLLALFLAILVWAAWQKGPSLRWKYESKQRVHKMAEVFPQTLGMSIQALRTGQTVPQVLEYLSRESPPPLKEELSLVCAEMDLGSPAEQALGRMLERFPNFSEFQQFLESYKISRQTGANLTHLLEVLLEGMEEKNRILRKMEAMTAQARLSGLLMGSLPILLGSVVFMMDPTMIIPLFTEKAGWAILLLAVVMESIGFLWIKQLLQLEV